MAASALATEAMNAAFGAVRLPEAESILRGFLDVVRAFETAPFGYEGICLVRGDGRFRALRRNRNWWEVHDYSRPGPLVRVAIPFQDGETGRDPFIIAAPSRDGREPEPAGARLVIITEGGTAVLTWTASTGLRRAVGCPFCTYRLTLAGPDAAFIVSFECTPDMREEDGPGTWEFRAWSYDLEENATVPCPTQPAPGLILPGAGPCATLCSVTWDRGSAAVPGDSYIIGVRAFGFPFLLRGQFSKPLRFDGSRGVRLADTLMIRDLVSIRDTSRVVLAAAFYLQLVDLDTGASVELGGDTSPDSSSFYTVNIDYDTGSAVADLSSSSAVLRVPLPPGTFAPPLCAPACHCGAGAAVAGGAGAAVACGADPTAAPLPPAVPAPPPPFSVQAH